MDVEPVLVGGVPLLLLHVLKGPEAAAHVVEHAVQHHPDAMGVKGLTHLGEVLVGAQAAVDLPVVPGVVAVAVTFKNGGEVYRICPQLLDMVRPIGDFADAVDGDAVILLWGSAEAQGVDLVKHTIFRPHKHLPFFPGEINYTHFSTRRPR